MTVVLRPAGPSVEILTGTHSADILMMTWWAKDTLAPPLNDHATSSNTATITASPVR